MEKQECDKELVIVFLSLTVGCSAFGPEMTKIEARAILHNQNRGILAGIPKTWYIIAFQPLESSIPASGHYC